MSDWMNKFVENDDDNELTLEEEFAAKNKIAEMVLEENEALLEDDDDFSDVLVAEQIEAVNKVNVMLINLVKALSEEVKNSTLVTQDKIDKIALHMQTQINSLEQKVTQSLLAMEDGNEKRALLFAQALEEINDLVADPDQMTDVFKVAPDIAMEAIEREAQGELSDEKPFDPDDEIFLPETSEDDLAKEIATIPDDEFDERQEEIRKLEHGDPVIEKENVVEDDELGVGEIQTLAVPEGLQGYTEHDYNVVMDFLNGDIKWQDMMKHAGGMKAAKALVDPVKEFMGIQ